jgi:subtilisin family serine protease
MEAYDNYDGTSYFSQRLGEILGDRAVLVTAAGNFGQSHWEGRFTDRQRDGYHDFTPEGGALQLRLRKDIDYKFLLSWSDNWLDPKIDFDLQVLNAAGTPLYDASGTPYRSSNRQGPQGPQERIRSFRSYLPGTQTYQLRIEARKLTKEAGPMPHLELYMYPPPEGSMPGPQPNSSLAGGLATSRSLSVVPVSATGFSHSSEGPTNDNRVRPDFAAGGAVQLQGAHLEGTSFATPRVAAAFALIMTKYPSWTVEQATEYLRSFCPADTDTDKDNQYGWGEIDFESLVQALTS